MIAALLTAAAFAAAPLGGGSSSVAPHRAPSASSASDPTVTVAIGRPLSVAPLASGFLGLSMEYPTIAKDIGTATHPDTAFDTLLAGLGQGAHPNIRVGGDSADHTWLPGTGAHTNPGLSYALTPDWLSAFHQFAVRTGAQLNLGIDLEANDPGLARREARGLLSSLGSSVGAWEVGNEPDLYAVFPWYSTHRGNRTIAHFTQSRSFSLSAYLHDFNRVAAALPPGPLAGPALGPPARWLAQLPAILAAEPRVDPVTYHAYPLNCYAARSSPEYPSLANLLSPVASVGLAAGLARYVEEAHAAHRRFRIDEMNSSSCGGATGVSNVFASALWVTDVLFALAERGVDGVNVQDYDGARYEPFSFVRAGGAWDVFVEPIYYGMLLFSRAAPPGSRLLEVGTEGRDSGSLQAFAAQTPELSVAQGAETITLTNDATTRAVSARVRAGGRSATLTTLLAPGVTATSNITLAGQRFSSPTTSGQLVGIPHTITLQPTGGSYDVTLPPASAAVLAVTR